MRKLSKRAKILMGVLIPVGAIVLVLGIIVLTQISKPGSKGPQPVQKDLKDAEFITSFGSKYLDYGISHPDESTLQNYFKWANPNFPWDHNSFDWDWSSITVEGSVGTAQLTIIASTNNQEWTGETNLLELSWTQHNLSESDVPLQYMIFNHGYDGKTTFLGLRRPASTQTYTTLCVCNCEMVSIADENVDTTISWFGGTSARLLVITFSDDVWMVENSFNRLSSLQTIALNKIWYVFDSFGGNANLNALHLGDNLDLNILGSSFVDCQKLDNIYGDFNSQPRQESPNYDSFVNCGQEASNKKIVNRDPAFSSTVFATYLTRIYLNLGDEGYSA